MDGKIPPAELIEVATANLKVGASGLRWKHKGLFHQTCAPWIAACFHRDSSTSVYVPLVGHRLSDGKIYALGRCPQCSQVLWAETTRNF